MNTARLFWSTRTWKTLCRRRMRNQFAGSCVSICTKTRSASNAAEAALNEHQKVEAAGLLDSNDRETREKLAASDVKHAKEMDDLSPHGRLQTLTTPVFLLHGEGDNVIPAAETQWMETELPRTALQAALVSPVLSHVNLDGANPGAGDLWRLVHFFALTLHAAERNS